MFLPSVHGSFASLLFIPIGAQLALGIYLKLHIHEQTIRPWAVRAHGVLGKAYPIFGWAQMLFGAITFRGYCRGGSLGTHRSTVRLPKPILALCRLYTTLPLPPASISCFLCFQDNVWHIISWVYFQILQKYLRRLTYLLGSGFIAYGSIMAILLLVGEAWVRRSGRSPEWWDSW